MRHWHEHSWPALQRRLPGAAVVLPIAAIEQHGHHLPLATDALLLEEVIRRAEPRLDERILLAPLQWLGNSHHHRDFAGTLSSSPRAYLDLLGDLIESALESGARRVALLNGHGGNATPGAQAVFEARQRHRDCMRLTLLCGTYWELGENPPSIPGLVQSRMGHACEWETSMILRLRPDLVGPLDRLEAVPQEVPSAPAAWGWTTRDRSAAGHIGDPRAATPQKGEQLFAHFANDVATWLNRLLD